MFRRSFAQKDAKKNKIEYERLKKFYEEYLEFGGFPQVVLAPDLEQKKAQLADIFKSYFEKDVRALADFREVNIFRDLLLLLLQRVGSKLEISKLASEVGITRATVYTYLSFLQGTYMLNLVSPYSKSVDRQVSGAKKLYICDNGIVNHFSRVSEGALLENAVRHDLFKKKALSQRLRFKPKPRIPSGTLYVSGSAQFVGTSPAGATISDTTSTSIITWTIPSVPVGGQGSVSFKVTVE